MQAFILLVSMLLSLLCASGACAQNYPLKTVRIVVPFPPVGAADLLSRTVGQKLSEATGQQFIVDNRPGAGGNIGAELVAAAPPDGYLLLMAPVSSFAVGMAAYSKLNWNLEKASCRWRWLRMCRTCWSCTRRCLQETSRRSSLSAKRIRGAQFRVPGERHVVAPRAGNVEAIGRLHGEPHSLQGQRAGAFGSDFPVTCSFSSTASRRPLPM
jgi:hypothetical protein